MAVQQLAFFQARLKVQRAHRHIHELITGFNNFMKSDFYRLSVDRHGDASNEVVSLKLTVTKSLPPGLALIIGDAVHNLRSSLDYIATFKVGSDDSRVNFPVSTTRQMLVSKSDSFKKILKLDRSFANFIANELEPYKGGVSKIWEITQLDNCDKHKLLVPTINSLGVSNPVFENKQTGSIVAPSMLMVEGGSGWVAPFGFSGPGSEGFEVTNHGQASGEISFSPGFPFENEPIIPTLIQLTQITAKTILALEKFCFGDSAYPYPIEFFPLDK